MKTQVVESREGNLRYDFKFLYAVGIFLIVAGHCQSGGISIGYDWFKPYAFHLGLFTFMSGYFYESSDEENIGKSILKRAKRLILPLYLWNIFYAVVVTITHQFGFSIGTEVTLKSLFITPWTNGHQFGYNLGGWYISPLFMIYVFHIIFHKAVGKFFNNYIMEVIYLVIGVCGIYMAIKGYYGGHYIIFVRFAYLLPFYGMGILYRTNLEKKDTCNNILYFAIIFAIQLAIISYYRGPKVYTPSKGYDFDNLWNPFFSGFVGIAFWLRISKIVEPLVEKSKAILTLANNTYSIMINQFLGFMLVKGVFGGINMLSGGKICDNFDWNEYMSNIWYSYLPFGLNQWFIVYIIAGLVLPIWMQKGIDLVKAKYIVKLDKKKSA